MPEFVLSTTATSCASRKLAKAAVSIISDSLRDRELVHEFDLVVTEACGNVVRHAYRDITPGKMEIRLRLSPPEYVDVKVTDWGRGFGPDIPPPSDPGPAAEGGRGLFIMSRLGDEFEIRSGRGKTVIHLRKYVEEKHWKKLA